MIIMFYKNKLKEIREENEIKQKFLADMLKIRENAYSQYETEYVIIPIKHLNTICNYFDVSIDYIFEFTSTRKYQSLSTNIDKDLMRDRLKELRKKYNLTQKELANSINVAASTISDYERRAKVIATPFLYDICKNYHVSADYMLGKTNSPKYIK